MSGRRRPRPQQRQRRRAGQPRTLRTRLVVASVVLIAVVCAVIGTVTTLALRTHLYGQLDGQLREVGARASGQFGPIGQGKDAVVPGGHPDGRPDGGQSGHAVNLTEFVSRGPQPSQNTVVARVDNGATTEGKVGHKSSDDFSMSAKSLTKAQLAALNAVPKDADKHTVDVPGLGSYRVQYVTGPNGTYYVAIPTKDVDDNINALILIEISVTVAGLVAAGIAGSVLVGVATRPLRKVAHTATRVSELPLHTGEVKLSERVPESECDPHTEVGQVGAALNRMLDHVHGALHARQQSEMRVRQFVADASHELRTPLASIRGYAELTRRGREQVGPDTRHALGRIESEAGRMTLLVEDLLLLARLDAGRPLQFEQTDLIPLVVDTVSDSRAAGMDHNWRLDLPDEPALVSADAARIQQVLVNLLGNARKHTPPGTTVTARVQRRGPWMCVDVEDNGQGIPPELLPHVFERFARGDSARSRSTGSTGLGLAIVQAVAAAHGGAVSVDSGPGRTVFTVHLPALVPAAARPAPETDWQSHSQAQHSSTTWVRQGA
ncbi:HAMP domain-containing sensor histidine kinase [Streptomyces sp. FXJ1.172]|uniref:sensor histidine kinase n=1 Tax=Streptomyces sp. FXJ1.172 TaxID=710705 RepID=UPI0007D00F9B|nr:HAMP domain-containing sensor histidine kinase [Streptomyces sp. FXJ1.172]WEO96536.1 HAMP domain-containing sensor histidine kinase [Streptomyces sp. FXJ1.172]